MKKLLCMTAAVLMAAVLFAQTVPPEPEVPGSLESELTAGTFGNEFDSQFNAGADFGSYDQHFIYGGLGNPGHTIKAVASGGKFNFGYYMPWKMPMSFYGSFSATDYTSRAVGKTYTTWNDNNHSEKLFKTKESYYLQPLFKTSDFNFQYLIGVGAGVNLVTGVQFAYSGDHRNWQDSKHKKTAVTDYKNPKQSYKQYGKNMDGSDFANSFGTGVVNKLQTALAGNKMPDLNGFGTFTDSFGIKIPVAFSTGSLNHVVSFYLGSSIQSQNGYYYFKQDKDLQKFKATHLRSLTTIKGDYAIEIPAADREGDSWEAGASLGLDFANEENRWKLTSDDGTPGGKVTGKYKHTKKPGLGFDMSVHGARVLKFESPKKSVRFNMKPSLKFDLETYMYNGTAGQRLYGYDSKVHGTLEAGPTKYEYTKTVKGDAAQYLNETVFTTTASLPMGLKILPENWKVGLLLGAAPKIEHKVTATWDRTNKHKKTRTTETMTINGTAPAAPPAGNQYPSQDDDVAKTRVDTWTITEQHTIGLTIPFEGGAHLDLKLDGVNLTQLERFVVQVFIPLGRGKKAASAQ